MQQHFSFPLSNYQSPIKFRLIELLTIKKKYFGTVSIEGCRNYSRQELTNSIVFSKRNSEILAVVRPNVIEFFLL